MRIPRKAIYQRVKKTINPITLYQLFIIIFLGKISNRHVFTDKFILILPPPAIEKKNQRETRQFNILRCKY